MAGLGRWGLSVSWDHEDIENGPAAGAGEYRAAPQQKSDGADHSKALERSGRRVVELLRQVWVPTLWASGPSEGQGDASRRDGLALQNPEQIVHVEVVVHQVSKRVDSELSQLVEGKSS